MNPMQITLRLIHVFAGIFWAGGVFFFARFVLPAIEGSGAGGRKVMQQLMVKQKIGIAIPVAALLTVLSGFTMYALNTSASSGVWMHSRPGIAYGVGGIGGLVALVMGAAMIGPSLERVVKLELAADTDGRAITRDEGATIAQLNRRAEVGTRVATVALLVAIAAMAVARYV
jgi:hypothetical protein